MKSEPADASIDDLASAPQQTLAWTGVRNYQARNFMRDHMRIGDDVLFYHSSCALPGIAGLARVASTAYADPTQFDATSRYHDPASSPSNPRWLSIDVTLASKVQLLPLTVLRTRPELADLWVLRRGNRLSITPVTDAQWNHLRALLVPV